MNIFKISIFIIMLFFSCFFSVAVSDRLKQTKENVIKSNKTSSLELKILAEDYAPYSFMDKGILKGFSIDLIHELLKETKNEHLKIEFWPWARIYEYVKKKPNVMTYLMTRLPERENLFHWVGPVSERIIWIWRLKERTDIKIKTLEDAKNYIIAAVPNSSVSIFLINNGFTKKQLEYVPSEDLALKKFLYGRNDLILEIPLRMSFEIKKLGKSMNDIEPVLKVTGEYPYYFAFSEKTSESTVKIFQDAFDLLHKNGTYNKILLKWMK